MTRSPAWKHCHDSALMDERTSPRTEFGIERQNICGQAIPKENSESRSRIDSESAIDAALAIHKKVSAIDRLR